MNTIKYKYAMDSVGRITDIETVDREHRGEYTCISCGQDLVSVIGNVRKRHFRHKVISGACSTETYLHQMGKRLFYDSYSSCLHDGTDGFPIMLECPRVCDHCVNKGPCDLPPQSRTFCLTRFFKEIYLERPDGDLVPDLLLLAESGEKLYVEIVVTHCASRHKISSGVRLIEIQIETEEDLSLIRSGKLYDDARVSVLNFDPKPVKADFHTECAQDVAVFILNPNGSAVIKEMKWFEYEQTDKSKWSYHEIVEPRSSPDRFRAELEAAYLDGHKVRNCFLCRYHAKPTRYQRDETEKPIFCRRYGSLRFSNDAVKCGSYRADRGVFEFLK